MKLKLLIAPLLVLLIIVLAIWVIVPGYTGLQAQKETLKTVQQKLADMQQKNQQAAKLKQELAGDTESEDVLSAYVPATAQEESIIENLSALAAGEGISIYNISVVGDTGKNQVATAANANNNMNLGAAATPAENLISISAGVAGPYEKIKSFMDKLAALKRYNNISALKIGASSATATASGGAATAASGNLQADMTIDFAYLANSNSSIASLDNSVLLSGKFDTSVIDQIKNKLSTDIAGINIGTTGKANPFLP